MFLLLTSLLGLAMAEDPAVPDRYAVMTGAGMPRQTSAKPGSLSCGDPDPCAEVLPGATRFERLDGKPYATGFNDNGKLVGWVVLSTDVTDMVGYSGKPLSTIVGLDTEGVITGGRVVHHSEPILLLGIPESSLREFVDAYTGFRADASVSLGASSSADHQVDGVSGATVTVLVANETILAAVRSLGTDVGVLEATPARPGHFVTDEAPWSWTELVDEGALGHLLLTPEQVGTTGDEPYVDLWFGLADAPHVGIPLLGEHRYHNAMEALEEGEHLFVVFNDGTYSFKGSGFARGGLFDRFRIEQGLTTQSFRDLDYMNLGPPPVDDAPRFREGGLFISRDHQIDPGEAFDFVFLATVYDTKRGAFTRDFTSFTSTHTTPTSVYEMEGLSMEWQIARDAWLATPWKTAIVALWLMLVTGLFVGRTWLTSDTERLKKIHIGVMAGSFLILGVGLTVQPSITQLLTILGSAAGEWRWSLFFSDPVVFLTWVFIAGILFIWGRGVFCGWTCPYGAMNELTFKLGRLLRLPEWEISLPIHRKLRYTRYAVLVGLVIAYLYDAQLGEQLAEIEPFKSTFFVPPWTRHPGLFLWWSVLLVWSAFTWRPFCQYLCPLGAGLAIPSYVRTSGPRRREFCTKCKICTRTCEPRAIDEHGVINGADCLNCMECEANYYDDQTCPPLVKQRRDKERLVASGTVSQDAS